eukprot:scaffold14749_cov24-Prasinocladus_malaysianus.AAC.1
MLRNAGRRAAAAVSPALSQNLGACALVPAACLRSSATAAAAVPATAADSPYLRFGSPEPL